MTTAPVPVTPELVTPEAANQALVRRTERRTFLERFVPAATFARLEESHAHFFAALTAPDISAPERTLLAAVGITALRDALKGEILERVLMPLMNTAVGFDTDRNPAKGWEGASYPPAVVLECATEAWLLGLSMTGNRWNIIGGRCYPRKEGYEDLLNKLCRFTATVDVPPIPREIQDDGGYLTIPVRIKYQLHEGGEQRSFAGAYKVRATKKNPTIVENVEGKARRKAYRELYGQLTGLFLADADGDVPAVAGVHQVGIGYEKKAEAAAVDAELAKASAVRARVKAAGDSARLEAARLDEILHRALGKVLAELEAADETAALKAIEKAARAAR